MTDRMEDTSRDGNSPEFVLLALDENSVATFHDPSTDSYFEVRVLGDLNFAENGPRRSVPKAVAMKRGVAYQKLVDDVTVAAGFRGKVRPRVVKP